MIMNWSTWAFGDGSKTSSILLKAAGPLGLALFNSFFIPTLVSLTTEYVTFELKSNKIKSKLYKFYFYLLMNTVLLPITQFDDIKSLLIFVSESNIYQVQEKINSNLINQSQFFLRYLITSAFLSQGLILLDLPHWFSTWSQRRNESQDDEYGKLKRRINVDSEPEQKKEKFRDQYSFDIAFNIAFNQVIYTVVFIYAIISPTISLLGAIYFGLKYFIDKYNLTVLYPKEYESNGDISKNVLSLA